MLPASTYQKNRNSAHSQRSEESNGEAFFIPMALDPNPAPGPPPLARRDNNTESANPSLRQGESRPNARDYFNAINSASRKLPFESDKENKDTGVSPDSPAGSRHSSQPNSPHIAHQYQERGRQVSAEPSDHLRKKKEPGSNSIKVIAQENHQDGSTSESRSRRNGENQVGKFMLQEAPKKKRNSKSDPIAPLVDTSIQAPKSRSAPSSATSQVTEQQAILLPHESPSSLHSEATLSGSPRDPPISLGLSSTNSPTSHSSPLSTQLKTLPERGDSLAKGKQPFTRKELDVGSASKFGKSSVSENGFNTPASAPPTATTQAVAIGNASGNTGLSRAQDSPSIGSLNDAIPPPPPLRARERLALHGGSSSDSFVAPRVPPNPPTSAHKVKPESVSTSKSDSSRNGEQPTSPKITRHPNASGFSMDEDAVHIAVDEGPQDQGGFLRRVSHSVRHARSYSDRGTRLSREQKWPKSPLMSSGSHSPAFAQGISSPMTLSPETKEGLTWFKNELRRERQKTLEQEQKLAELEAALEAKTSIKQMNTELREKRSTMVVLDTQKEIVVRELEVLTEHIAAAKRSGEPLDIGKLSNAVLREFAESLQKLKESFTPQIEDLTQQRNNIIEEVSSLTQRRDQYSQEFEQLSKKNAQLADLNDQLVHQIQELYRANAGPALDVVRPPPNGLGIYTQNQKEKSETRDPRPSLADSSLTGSTMVQEQDIEPATFLTAPQVVNIRKAQPKKFNWKKGGHNVAKGVTKGLKAAFNDGNRNQKEGQYVEGMAYGQMQQQDYPASSLPRSQNQEIRQGLGGFFGNPKQRPQQWKNSPNSSMAGVNSDGGLSEPRPCTVSENGSLMFAALFGSELEHRAEYERVNIPGIVMRCIQEVDARGKKSLLTVLHI
jgi:hypothetical protein